MSRLKDFLRPFMRPRVLWDLFMVWAALINLYLIAFDLSYLWLRPLYFQYMPVVSSSYDPVKGIEPHPLTQAMLDQVDATRRILEIEADAPELEQHLVELRSLTRRILLENPFERSGQTRFFEILKQDFARETGLRPADARSVGAFATAAERYWSGTATELHAKLDRFDTNSRTKFELNYFREFNPGGNLTDHFWMIDLPFLTLFWIEFLVRWYLAVRRRTYNRWFFFPIFNWYDLLGLIPTRHFRIFRLLRAVSMYMRLRRSELSSVGQDFISRTVAYVANIITEEVADRVALRILDELHEEISNDTHVQIARDTVEPRRGEIEEVIANQVRLLITDDATLSHFRELLRLNLETAVEHSETLRSVPLPHAVLKPIVRSIGEVVLDTTVETVAATIESEEGRQAVERVASAVLEDLFYGPGLVEIESLAKEIGLQIIERLKEVVAVKKWAETDEAKRGVE